MKNKAIKLVTILSTTFCLTACQSQNKVNFSSASNSSAFVSDSDYSSVLNNLHVKQLTNPDDLNHDVDWSMTQNSNYKMFKEKMQVFSTKLSESFVKSDYSNRKNITISPLSIEMCLGLAVYCSNNQTREELLSALDIDFATFNQFYKLFYNELARQYKNESGEITSELSLTDSIWIDDDINLLESGLNDLNNNYYCNSFSADFGENNKETVEAMQYFIEQKTHGLLKPDLQFSPLTLFVLMNTLYLKDIWNGWGGDLTTTSNYQFKNADDSISSKELLVGSTKSGKTLETADYSCFFTNTNSGRSLFFVKPNEGKTLKDVFNKDTMQFVLNTNNYIYQDDEKLERYHTNCVFPEFKAESDIDLKAMFVNDFNVRSLFSDACDFSNITNERGYVDQFKHIAKLDVNKSGIEGAAVTYMAYAGAAGPDEYTDVYETFVVDQEFGFILTNYDGDVIFSGAVTNID